MEKVLLLGGTGAIGVYLTQELMSLGFKVFVTSRSERISDDDKLTFIRGNARDNKFVENTLTKDKYDAIVDFMIYGTEEFSYRVDFLLMNCRHYVFLSSTRVFTKTNLPVTEKSLRRLDVTNDGEHKKTDNYNLAKARQEDILKKSNYSNWTIVRPGLVYSRNRFPLCTLEAGTIFFRAYCNCPVILPQEMLEKHTSMIWGKDAAKMIARLVLNPQSYCDDFNVVSHKRNTWAEVAQFYQKLIGLTIIPTTLDKYIQTTKCDRRILNSRMSNKVSDNSKILKITGMEKESIASIFDGLAIELKGVLNRSKISQINYTLNAEMDKISRSRISLKKASPKEKIEYFMV
jgi:nucleoside-diphosphate-sugar epimerase